MRDSLRRHPGQAVWLFIYLLASLLLLLLVACGGGSGGGPGVQPPVIHYGTSTAVYTRGTAIAPDAPTNAGGAASSFTIQPALPAGLSLNATSGTISGTPTAVIAQTTYTVTASNAGGSGQDILKIT